MRVSIPVRLTTQSKTGIAPTGVERTCPVCGSAKSVPHWEKAGLQIARCTDCGMVFVNPAPAGMASGEFYNTEGAAYYLSPAKLDSDYAEVRFERELKLFREFCPRGSVLDVGCGSGAFLFQLRKLWPADYQVFGNDVSGSPLDYAEFRGVPVTRGNFLEMTFRQGSSKNWAAYSDSGGTSQSLIALAAKTGGLDAITFWAVVEHLAEPKKFLSKAQELLKPGGLCFVLVPNFQSLATRLLGVKYRYVYPQHLNYFTAQTLRRFVESQFSVIELRATHFNPVIIWQDWRRGGREVSNTERGELLKRTTAYKQSAVLKPVKALYRATERILGSFSLADNLVAVLRKR